MSDERTYLGDGVYAWFDGYQIWLMTERENGRHNIALEPSVMTALQVYADKVWTPRGVRSGEDVSD